MAATHAATFLPSHYIHNCKIQPSFPAVLLPRASSERRPSYNSLVFQVCFCSWKIICCKNFKNGYGIGQNADSCKSRIAETLILSVAQLYLICEISPLEPQFLEDQWYRVCRNSLTGCKALGPSGKIWSFKAEGLVHGGTTRHCSADEDCAKNLHSLPLWLHS